jgi:hypothetical protein
MNSDYNILLKKIDSFIRKYYFNRILKGFLLSLAVYISWYLLVILAEYFGRFSVSVRTFLFTVSIIIYILVFINLILIPALKLFRLGKTISHKQAAEIIGEFFPQVSDKLKNTLELSELINNNPDTADLIEASINQKSKTFVSLDFLKAINLKKNIKLGKYLLPSLLILFLIFSFRPDIITEATERIVNFEKEYIPPAPFVFVLENDSLVARKGKDFEIKLRTEGNIAPQQVKIFIGGNEFFMEKLNNKEFKYIIKNLNNDVKISFSALDIKSSEYVIKVLPSPLILDFKILVTAPSYTGIEDKVYTNSGDISVPLGASITWSFNTALVEELHMVFDTSIITAKKDPSGFKVIKNIVKPTTYSIKIKNQYFEENTGITYNINVIPDLYPSIRVRNMQDSTDLSIMLFNGFIDDDYGFSDLRFICKPGEKTDSLIVVKIPFTRTLTSQTFYFAFDFLSVDVKGKKITYYFDVADNDAINGAKRSRTQEMEFIIPGNEEIRQITEETNKETESKIEQAKELNEQIKKDLDNLKKRLLNENIPAWERAQIMQQIIDAQNNLENLVNQIKKEQSNLTQFKQQFSKNEELLKKQEEINKLWESLMDEEMKKLMEELQKLMQDFKKDEFFKIADNIKLTTEDLEKQMDNTLELLKRSEVEEKFKTTIEDLKKLSEEHQKLSEETKDKNLSQEELLRKHEEHKQEFDKINKEYEKALEKNNELKNPIKIDDFKKEIEEIQKTFDQSKQELSEKKNQKASKSQKQNSENMQQLAEQMEGAMQADAQESQEENIQDLKQLIENLITFSFIQEDVMIGKRGLSNRDPRYKEFIVTQRNLIDNFKIIKDSIEAMASRIPELGPLVSKDVKLIRNHLQMIMDNIPDNVRHRIEASQQQVMTSANNLALLLLELMEQMQEQMAMQNNNSGQCNKCKNKGQGSQAGQMREMMQGLKQQMQDMINQMKEGGKQQGGKQSEQLAKMLMQQEIMQQMINEMMNSGISPENPKILQEINRMIEENLKDIINGNITPTTINRQEQILTRLLQAEKSEREREIDNKRKSNEAKEYKISNPEKSFKDAEKQIRFNELLQMSNIKLNNYYNSKYKDYLKSLENNK